MSTPNLEQVVADAIKELTHRWDSDEQQCYETILAALRSAQPEPKQAPNIALIQVAGRCMDSLRRYAVECFPEIINDQKHFVRVLMESWADEIQAVLPQALDALREAQPEPQQFPAPEGTGTGSSLRVYEATTAITQLVDGKCSQAEIADVLSRYFAPFVGGGDTERVDCLEAGHGNLYRIGEHKWCLGSFGPQPTVREVIDQARAATTPSNGRDK